MINRVVLVGRITKDVDLRATSGNVYVTRFTVAVNRQFTSQNGERQADFIQCVAWRNQAEFMKNYVKKGALIGVEGRIQTGQYEDKDGQTRYTTEVQVDSIQLLESKGDGTRTVEYDEKPGKNQDSDDFYETSKKLAAEDDLPF